MAPDTITLPSGALFDARRTALGVWKGWVIAPFLYFVVLSQTLKQQDDVRRIARSFIGSAFFVCIAAYGSAIAGEGLTHDLRLRGFFESANYLALYLVPALLINARYYLTESVYPARRVGRPGRWGYCDLCTLVVIAYCLMFTRSYAAILGVFGAIGLYLTVLFFRHPVWRRKMSRAILMLALAFSLIILSQARTEKFRQFFEFSGRSSTSVRLEIYRTSLDLLIGHPYIGVGPGLFQPNYQNQSIKTLNHAPMEWNMPHPHNIFLGFWLNAGILGLMGFILMLALVHRPFTWPLIALWGTLIHGLFDMPFWKNDLAMIFWLLLAMILTLQRLNDKGVRPAD
jgi:O-antigen ligase